MKRAAGYITDDGSFFEKEDEARLYEAELRLRARLTAAVPVVDPDRFLGIVWNILPELREYLNVYKAPHADAEVEDRAEDRREETAKADDGLGHVSSAEEDLASLLKFKARGSEHVPNVGSGARPEKVQDGRKKHGARGRGSDASNVRSS